MRAWPSVVPNAVMSKACMHTESFPLQRKHVSRLIEGEPSAVVFGPGNLRRSLNILSPDGAFYRFRFLFCRLV